MGAGKYFIVWGKGSLTWKSDRKKAEHKRVDILARLRNWLPSFPWNGIRIGGHIIALNKIRY